MKRWFIGFVVLFMIIVPCIPVAALAEGAISAFTCDVVKVRTEGNKHIATLTITVAANQTISDVKIEPGGYTQAQISAGDSYTWNVEPTVETSQLGKSLTLTLTYKDASGAEQTTTTSVTIPQPDATTTTTTPATTAPDQSDKASVSVKVSTPKTSVRQGDKVKLTYEVVNTGTVTINYLELSEPSLGIIDSESNVEPGTKLTFSYEIKNISQSFESKPRVTYVVDGKNKSASGNTLKISVAAAKITATLEASKSQIDPGESVTLKATIANKGDITFKTVTISEKTLGEMGSVSNMEPGDTKTVTKEVTPQDSAVYQLVITAVDSTGKKYTYSSKSATVKVADNPVPVTLTLSAQTDTVQLSEPGMVSFSIDIENLSKKTLSNITVTDQDNNVVQTLSQLEYGTKTLDYECMVSKTTEFVFTATVVVDGVTSNFRSAPVEVAIAGDSSPTATDDTTPATVTSPAAMTTPASQGGDPMTKVLIGLVVVIAIVITALIALVIYGNSIRPDGRKRTTQRNTPQSHRGGSYNDRYSGSASKKSGSSGRSGSDRRRR